MNVNSVEEEVIYKLLTEANEGGNVDINKSLSDKENLYMQEIIDHISSMGKNRENYAYRNLSGKNRIKNLVKKILRKMLKWYIEPICFQQTDFNSAVMSSIGRLTELQTMHIKNINQILEKNHQLENNIRQILDQHQRLQSTIHDFESVQAISNRKICDINNKLEKLESLDLKIFNQEDNFFNKISTSQSGEDAIVSYIIKVLGISFNKCTYLDLGANHAKELSNTYYLYQKGARGVLVEANPNLISELKFYRSEDIILNYCVVDKKHTDKTEFYLVNGDGLSSPNKNSIDLCLKKNATLKIDDVVTVETITLDEIFNKYFDGAPTVLNVDIEGNELEILKNIDFKKYRPLIIIIEMIPYQNNLVIENKNKEILDFMTKNNYTEYAFTGINSIFLDKSQI